MVSWKHGIAQSHKGSLKPLIHESKTALKKNKKLDMLKIFESNSGRDYFVASTQLSLRSLHGKKKNEKKRKSLKYGPFYNCPLSDVSI